MEIEEKKWSVFYFRFFMNYNFSIITENLLQIIFLLNAFLPHGPSMYTALTMTKLCNF